MRFVYLLFLIVLVGAIGVFCYQNIEPLTVQFFEWRATLPTAAILAGTYVLGMLSGWSVLGVFRRSLERVTEERVRTQ